MNHKRGRAKHQRGGCLLCKPHKDERSAKTSLPGDTRRALAAEAKIEESALERHCADPCVVGDCPECAAPTEEGC